MRTAEMRIVQVFNDKVKAKWQLLSENDLSEICGDLGKLITKLLERYGLPRDEATDEVYRFCLTFDS